MWWRILVCWLGIAIVLSVLLCGLFSVGGKSDKEKWVQKKKIRKR